MIISGAFVGLIAALASRGLTGLLCLENAGLDFVVRLFSMFGIILFLHYWRDCK